MSLFLGIILAILVFLLVVLVHEFGHFSTARLTGMKVQEFWFGLPPRMKRLWKDKSGTEYTWNWLPIWGFVRILGEDPMGDDAYRQWAFMTRPWAARVLVLIAGVMMNFLLAIAIFTVLFYIGAKPIAINPLVNTPTKSFFLPSFEEAVDMWYIEHSGIEISSVSGSLAYMAGIGEWERVISMNHHNVSRVDDFIRTVQTSSSVDIRVEKNGIEREVHLIPDNGKIWVRVGYKDARMNSSFEKKEWIMSALLSGIRETYYSSKMTLDFLGQMVRGIFAPKNSAEFEEAKSMLSGPIGVGVTFVGLIEINAPASLIFVVIALISVNLWVFNLLPIPALDGGRIVTTTFYSLIVRYFHAWKAWFLKFEKYFHITGFMLLMWLTVIVAWLDISRFF